MIAEVVRNEEFRIWNSEWVYEFRIPNSEFQIQKATRKPSCMVRGAYERFVLAAGVP